MKILHTADWHLGKRLESISRHEEQIIVLEEIERLADEHAVDAVVIAGDLFDTFNPPNESIDLLYRTCKNLSKNGTRPVIAIAGNHDSPERVEVPEHFARSCGIVFVGFPDTVVTPFELPSGLKITRSDVGFIELKLPKFDYPLRIFAIPYVNENRLKIFLGTEDTDEKLRQLLTDKWQISADKYADEKGVNIAIAHLLIMRKGGEMPVESDDEKPIRIGGASAIYTENFPPQFQYVALGHIHLQMVVDKKRAPFVYSGSPLAYSFNETEQEKYVIIVDVEPNELAHFKRVALKTPKKLSTVSFDDVNVALDWLAQYPDNLIRLSFISDSALSPTLTKQLYDAHVGIVPPIIPVIKDDSIFSNAGETMSLGEKTIKQHFEAYYQLKNKGQKPGDELLNLFDEVLSVVSSHT